MAPSRAVPATREVRSPWSGEVVGEVPVRSVADVSAMLDRADRSLDRSQRSGGLQPFERAEILERAARRLEQDRERFAALLVAEAGKPVTLARTEVTRAVDTLRFSAVEARRLGASPVATEGAASGAGTIALSLPRPGGVVAAITPFNFPLNLSVHKIGPAIAAGCPVIHKPASATPLSAVALRELLVEEGLPPDRLQVAVGPAADIARLLLSDRRVHLLTFTGSSDVGWQLAQQAVHTRVSLELGNNTPLIVCADADLDAAAAAVVSGGFGFAGQSCISVQRVIAEASIEQDLVERILQRTGQIGVGDPSDESTLVGPLISAAAAHDVRDRLRQTVAAGATPVTEHPASSGSDFALDGAPETLVPAVVLRGLPENSPMARDELFGPAVAVTTFAARDDVGAIATANSTRYGLQAGVFCADLDRAVRFAEALSFAGVTINESPTFRTDPMPYGGMNDSGNTREGPAWAIHEMLEPQLLVIRAR